MNCRFILFFHRILQCFRNGKHLFREKIMFIHFRNTKGHPNAFRETFHDNGELNMARLIHLYKECGIHVPIRVNHVPTMLGEDMVNMGYDALGRHFAIGYLKGLLEAAGA
jgi:mannonate dehydratase